MSTNGPARRSARMLAIMFTDLVGSVDLKARLGAQRYGRLIAHHDAVFSDVLAELAGASIYQNTGDGFIATFDTHSDAVRAALEFQSRLREAPAPEGDLSVRIGLHVGQVASVDADSARNKLVGLALDLTSRVMHLAVGGQILMTRHVFDDARQYVREHPGGRGLDIVWMAHGPYRLKGYDEPVEIFEVGAQGCAPLRAPGDSAAAERSVSHEAAELLGWRPAANQPIPHSHGWILERKLGEGGVGEVWLGRHEMLGSHHVFKFCFDPDKLRTLKRELTLIRLIHRRLGERKDIARLHNVQFDESPYFLEGEYSEDGDFASWAAAQGGLNAIDIDQRLDLVAACAEAVAAAHSVGVLHKDIKPGNVLIGRNDDGSIFPRLADFGIGELTGSAQLTDLGLTVTGFTELAPDDGRASLSGTRIYLPPEILAGQPYTTQGDVYALGVMLYQAVVGDFTRPLAAGWERDVDDEILRADIASCVDGDPARRLPAAAELAQRLRDLPARRAALAAERATSAAEFRRRRATRILAIVGAVLIVVAGLAVAALMREQDLRAGAERESAKLAAVSQFLDQMLTSANPDKSGGKALTVLEVVDLAADRLKGNTALHREPEVEASVRTTLGDTYFSLGQYAKAGEQLKAALAVTESTFGAGSRQYWVAKGRLARAYWKQGRLSESETMWNDSIKGLEGLVGRTHPDTLAAMRGLAALLHSQGRYREAEALGNELVALHTRLYGPEHDKTLQVKNNLALVYFQQGRYDLAEPLFREVLGIRRQRLGPEHPDTLASLSNMGIVYWGEGRYELAEPLMLELVDAERRVLGPRHPTTFQSISNLGALYWAQGRFAEAEPLFLESYQGQRDTLGADNPATLQAMSNLADDYKALGKYDKAEPLLVDALAKQRRLGDEHPDVLTTLHNLGELHLMEGRLDDAMREMQQVEAARRRTLGDEHPDTLSSAVVLVEVLARAGEYKRADALGETTLKVAREKIGEDQSLTARALISLAILRTAEGRPNEALDLAVRAASIGDRTLGSDHPQTLRARHEQARALARLNRRAEALKIARMVYEQRVEVLGATHPDTLTTAALIRDLGGSK